MALAPALSARGPTSALRSSSRRPTMTRSSVVVTSSLEFQGCTEPLPRPVKVVGMGSSGQDLLAQVASFPHPDDKLRTEQFETQGGGNCGNALTAAARLGLSPACVSKIGGDAVGDGIVAEFQGDGVDTQFILRVPGAPSPFTYIIVDRQGGTRTCIHTPGEPMTPEEMTPQLAASVLDGAVLVYFDGRLTEAALVLAAAAQSRGVPVLVEAERLRPGLEQLLSMADYVVSSAHFPESWTGEQCLGDALLATFSRLPRARWLVTTLGSRGSVLLERAELAEAEAAPEVVLEDLVSQLLGEAAANAAAAEAAGQQSEQQPVCVSASAVPIHACGQASSGGLRRFCLRRGEAETQRVLAAAAQAAAAAAAANADAGNAAGYSMGSGEGGDAAAAVAEVVCCAAKVTATTAARLPEGAVVDTTGAGDAFIGSMVYGLATGMPVQCAVQLASVVAACKCTALGPRPGLPWRSNLAPSLLA